MHAGKIPGKQAKIRHFFLYLHSRGPCDTIQAHRMALPAVPGRGAAHAGQACPVRKNRVVSGFFR